MVTGWVLILGQIRSDQNQFTGVPTNCRLQKNPVLVLVSIQILDHSFSGLRRFTRFLQTGEGVQTQQMAFFLLEQLGSGGGER